MSSRNNPLAPYPVVAAGDLSADVTSAVTGIVYQDNVVYQCLLTGAPVGTLYVQGSVDYKPGPPADNNTPAFAGTWVDIIHADIAGADQVIFDLNQLPVPYIRVFYDFTSGTGSMDVLVSAKKV